MVKHYSACILVAFSNNLILLYTLANSMPNFGAELWQIIPGNKLSNYRRGYRNKYDDTHHDVQYAKAMQ